MFELAAHFLGLGYGSGRDFEGMRNGRHFTDFTEPTMQVFLSAAGTGLTVEQLWTTSDVRPGRVNERWHNMIPRKA